MTTVPPITNPRAYATPLLTAYLRQLLRAEAGRCNALVGVIQTELARRQAAAIPKQK
jgi:hypothetical protein